MTFPLRARKLATRNGFLDVFNETVRSTGGRSQQVFDDLSAEASFIYGQAPFPSYEAFKKWRSRL